MMQNFNKLTPAETERLAILAEECAEIQQAIGKILRHGYESKDPTNPKHISNRDDLAREIADFEVMLSLLCNSNDIDGNVIEKYMKKKINSEKYFHHQDIT